MMEKLEDKYQSILNENTASLSLDFQEQESPEVNLEQKKEELEKRRNIAKGIITNSRYKQYVLTIVPADPNGADNVKKGYIADDKDFVPVFQNGKPNSNALLSDDAYNNAPICARGAVTTICAELREFSEGKRDGISQKTIDMLNKTATALHTRQEEKRVKFVIWPSIAATDARMEKELLNSLLWIVEDAKIKEDNLKTDGLTAQQIQEEEKTIQSSTPSKKPKRER